MSAIVLYRHPLSGHSHRAQLFLSLLGLEHRIVDVDLMKGAHKQPEFLAKNPLGQVPVIDDNGVVVSDSNAILTYLATRYDTARTWLPADPAKAAEVQRWLSVAANEVSNGPAAARLVTVFGAKLDAERAKGIADRLLTVVEGVLAGRAFITGAAPTIADVALYTYIAHAPEGNVSLQPYANVRAWLTRVEALKGFVPMQRTAVGLAA